MRESRSSLNSNCIFVIPASDTVELLVNYQGMKWSNENIDEERLRLFSEKCNGFNITFFENDNGKILMFSPKGSLDVSVEIFFEGIFMDELPCAFFDKDRKTYDNFALPASTTELTISVNSEGIFSVEWVFQDENDDADSSIEEDEEDGFNSGDVSDLDQEADSSACLDHENDSEDEEDLDGEKDPEDEEDLDGEKDPEDEEDQNDEKDPADEEDQNDEKNPEDEEAPEEEKGLDDKTGLADEILKLKKICEELTVENDRMRIRAEELAGDIARLEIKVEEIGKYPEHAPYPDDKDREIIELYRLIRQLADDRFNGLYVETKNVEIDSLTAAVIKQKKALEEKNVSKARLEQELDFIENETSKEKDEITDLMIRIDKAETIQNECYANLGEKQRRLTELLADLNMSMDVFEKYSADTSFSNIISEAETMKVRLEERLKSLIQERQRDCDERSDSLNSPSCADLTDHCQEAEKQE